MNRAGGGGYNADFLQSVIFPDFQNHQNIKQLEMAAIHRRPFRTHFL